MEGPSKKSLATFTPLHQKFEPGLFGRGKGEYLHARSLKEGVDLLDSHAPSNSHRTGAAGRARRKGAELVEKAMREEYPGKVVDAALRRLHNRTGRSLDENGSLLAVTRGDLDLLRKDLHKQPTTFNQLYERHGPGLFGIGEGEFLEAQKVGHGQRHVRLYARAPLIPNGGEEMALATSLARKESAKLVRRAMENGYPSAVAKAAFRKVREKVLATGRDLKNEVTRGDLELLRKELRTKQPATFTQVLKNFDTASIERPGERVRGAGTKVYIHAHDSGSEADAMRQAKYATGAKLVRQTIVNEYGEAVANAALAEVAQGRDLGEGITLADLRLLDQELTHQQDRYRGLGEDLIRNLAENAEPKAATKLYNAIIAGPNDRSPKAMADRFEQLKGMVNDACKATFRCEVEPPDDKGRWAFAFKIGDAEIYRSDWLQNDFSLYHIEAALRQESAKGRSPEDMFGLFQQLKAAATDSVRIQLTCVIEPPNDNGRWALALWTAGGEIYRLDRQNGPGQHYIDFFASALGRAIEANRPSASYVEKVLETAERYALGNIQTMSDDGNQRTWIAKNLDNPTFARANFLRLEDVDADVDAARFRAVFRQDGPHPEVTLEFSDRPGNMGELRGQPLRKILEARQYASLRDIAVSGHLSKSDPLVRQLAGTVWESAVDAMGIGNGTGTALSNYIASLQGEEREAVAGVLRRTTIGLVSLADIYLPAAADQHPAVPEEDQRGD